MKYKRVMVIGLDGATFDLIKPWAAQGYLPNLQKLMNEGASGNLQSVHPPESPLAWTSFATGKNPGQHKIFGFYEPKRDAAYSLSPITAGSNQAKTVYRMLAEAGKRVVMVSVPFTFPPEPLPDGIVVPGEFSIPGEDGYARLVCHPPEIGDEIRQNFDDYRLMVDTSLIYHEKAQFAADLHHTTDNVMAIANHFLDTREWDFFMMVFSGTDQVGHYFFRDLVENGSYADVMLNYYSYVDKAVGRLLARADDETLFLVMSDHGMTHFRDYFCLNLWLAENGYLVFKRPFLRKLKRMGINFMNKSGLMSALLNMVDLRKLSKGSVSSALQFTDVDFSKTKAFAYGFGSIRLNVKGREANGVIDPSAYEQVRDEIIGRLQAATDRQAGLPIAERVYRREEIYFGPFVENAPDIVVESDRFWPNGLAGVGPFSNLYASMLEKSPIINGMHTLNGIFLAKGAHIRPNYALEGARIIDLAPTILHALGLPIPEDMDGRLLTDMFEPDFLAARQPVYTEGTGVVHSEQYVWAAGEEEALLERLQDLGYMA
ncbi:MAG: alkaline phosphatase family protein [Candidatus Promineifilaceae bacterium]